MIISALLVLLQTQPLPQLPEAERKEGDASRPSRMARFGELQQKAMKLAESARALGDWEREAALARVAMEKVFQRSGWDSEADTFALETVRAVDAIPPWEFDKRGETFFGLIGRRYNLDDDQRDQLQRLVVREAFGVFARHSDDILTYASEAIGARAAGEPFTAEQVARWTKLAEPVLHAAHDSVGRVTAEMMESLDDEQRRRMKEDLTAAERRFTAITQAAERWKAGEWSAEDWGMEDDPIQSGKALAARGQGGSREGEAPAEPAGGDPAAISAEAAAGAAAARDGRDARAIMLARREAQQRVNELEAAARRAEETGNSEETERANAELHAARAALQRARSDARDEAARIDAARRAAEARGDIAGETTPIAPPPGDAAGPAAMPNADAGPRIEGDPRGEKSRRPMPTDAWGRYVEAFIRKYHLDEPQQQRALLIYEEAKKEADAVRLRAAKRSAGGETEAPAGVESTVAAPAAVLTESQQREVDRTLTQMKARLEKIPTRAQRKNAEPGDLPDPSAAPGAKPGRGERPRERVIGSDAPKPSPPKP